MKILTIVIAFLSMLLMITPFAVQAQKPAKVTITINSLFAKSSDACGKMDFFAKIYIGEKVKSFPVREGNNLTNLNWQFTAFTPADKITFSVEIWDDDDFACGGGDDRVNVDGTSNKITKTFSTLVPYNHDMRSWGVQTAGNEVAEIVFHINIEPEAGKVASVPVTSPVTTVPATPGTITRIPVTRQAPKIILLTKGNWLIKEIYTRSAGAYFPTFLFTHAPNCKKDNYFSFNLKINPFLSYLFQIKVYNL